MSDSRDAPYGPPSFNKDCTMTTDNDQAPRAGDGKLRQAAQKALDRLEIYAQDHCWPVDREACDNLRAALTAVPAAPAAVPMCSEQAVLHALTMARSETHQQGDAALWQAFGRAMWRQFNAMAAAHAAAPATKLEDFCGVMQEVREAETARGTNHRIAKWTCPNCGKACSTLELDGEFCHGDGLCITFANGERIIRCTSCWLGSESTDPSSNVIDLRGLAERAGIRMDLWDMGAASHAYSFGVNGVTREHLEKFAALYGFACWNAALEANPPHLQGFVSRAIGSLFQAPATADGSQP